MTVIAVGIAVSLGCAPAFETYEPVIQDSRADDDALFQSALDVVRDHGHAVSGERREDGTIATMWQFAGSSMGANYKYRWRIAVAKGKVYVFSDCMKQVGGNQKAWKRCGDRQAGGRTETGNKLASEIIAKATR
jgi:hypothetical protein